MRQYKVRVYFGHTDSTVIINANSPAEALRIAKAQYQGCRVSDSVVEVR